MPTLCLIIDLEGIHGIDDLAMLLATEERYREARRLATAEVLSIVERALEQGYDRVLISDSHRGGQRGSNLLADALPRGCSVHVLDDAFDLELLRQADAISAIGMHAAGGHKDFYNQEAFAAHTQELHVALSSRGTLLSESDLLLGLAAEIGVPVLFVTGDDALGSHLAQQHPRVPFFCRKTSLSTLHARSVAKEAWQKQLEELPWRTAPLPAPPDHPWVLHTSSRWYADVLEQKGALRRGPLEIQIDGGSFSERHQALLALLEKSSACWKETMLQRPLLQTLQGIMQRSFPALGTKTTSAVPRPDLQRDAQRAWEAFFRHTHVAPAGSHLSAQQEEHTALRALVLHSLSGHAATWQPLGGPTVRERLDRALPELMRLPQEYPLHEDLDRLLARADALYLSMLYGQTVTPPKREELVEWVRHCAEERSPLYAWLIAELARKCGMEVPTFPVEELLRHENPLFQLYAHTHVILLENDYFLRCLDEAGVRPRFGASIELFHQLTAHVIDGGYTDLAAEMAFCLQALGEAESPLLPQLLRHIMDRQGEDGQVMDALQLAPGDSEEQNTSPDFAHCTGVALVALAHAAQNLPQ
ncbi:M55 family metallopeptidase [Myxococcota bacterium]|nr:M55 family metallopeptidase [Myxococcota bacterium]